MSDPGHGKCEDTKLEMAEEDNESLEEKCWEEQYKGDSRKWLIRDASTKMPRGLLCSTMKESYGKPERENSDAKSMGTRKQLLLKRFFEEASAEVIKERDCPQALDDNNYCTEYDGNYNAEGFKLDDNFFKKNTELFQKYPLYSSTPASYYSYNQQQYPKQVLHGLTRVTDNQNIFKRNGQFSKPIGESLDFVEL